MDAINHLPVNNPNNEYNQLVSLNLTFRGERVLTADKPSDLRRTIGVAVVEYKR